ncbi:nitrilase-related carbon-nitrogen hydrolase [Biformimicrobium ophioploci]|nr:nitrilase-related carbon-nitrogen hydrolase [Microbulbifer sp. NKW57]
MLRVAALQFATGSCAEENLATCLRMIDAAAVQGAKLLVLPEFCNHISWYRDQAHAWQEALEPEGGFLQAIAARALRHRIHILINVSLRRRHPAISVTSILYGPDGTCLGEADKQGLMGHENDFFVPAKEAGKVIDTGIGRIGIFACRDGISFEPARRLALMGADLLCNSLNSFAFDEASLHVPARAAENRLYLVAANKVGPLVPGEELGMVSRLTAIPQALLYGAGESQVVQPDGRALRRAPRAQEAVLIADLPPAAERRRLRGAGLLPRRPEIYRSLLQAPLQANGESATRTAEAIEVALVRPLGEGRAALAHVEELLQQLPASTQLALLPERFAQTGEHPVAAAVIRERLQAICQARNLQVCTSLVEGDAHVGVLLDGSGVRLQQPQLHVERGCGDALLTAELEWGRVAILVGDDCLSPELAKMAALAGAHCLLLPCAAPDTRVARGAANGTLDLALLLAARAAENRLCLAACAGSAEGMLATLEREFTLMSPWPSRRFDGNINAPLRTPQSGETTLQVLHPRAAENKMISANTDLLRDRPLQSCAALLRREEEIACAD